MTDATHDDVLVIEGSHTSLYREMTGSDGDGDPLWTARFIQTKPDAVVQAQLKYLRAGAQVLLPDTYQASIEGYVKNLGVSPEEAHNLIIRAVELAKKAKSIYKEECLKTGREYFDAIIAGATGPYGAHLNDGSEYTGTYSNGVTVEELWRWHRKQFNALTESDLDILLIATIPCEKEAVAVAELLKEYPKTKAWITFSCKDGKSLSNGDDFKTAARKCVDTNPDQVIGVGANCLNPKFVSDLFNGVNEGRKKPVPLVVFPNSGERYDKLLGWVDKDKCIPLKDFVDEWLRLGVKYVGGCCRTNVSDIEGVADKVRSWNQRKKETSG